MSEEMSAGYDTTVILGNSGENLHIIIDRKENENCHLPFEVDIFLSVEEAAVLETKIRKTLLEAVGGEMP